MFLFHRERNDNFGFDAPVWLHIFATCSCLVANSLIVLFFFEKSKRGWASNYLGIFPFSNAMMDVNLGYYERYCRVGLLDVLPSTASPYERALGNMRGRSRTRMGTNEIGSNVQFDLECGLLALMPLRQQLTLAEAQRYGFEEWLEKSFNIISGV